ncbi:TetR/AcrR family transcriptional regulator [Devriesea agamarum]|uniref:TetR/AcrR family transcriptional regulator n=1 Tax=Devriesea agamarum TaxID=472569 RepID=UPI00071C8A62|nr:hypothetical protein [Devriesea agamarum]
MTASVRGARRREEIILACADIIRESGPAAVSHRSVARRVGCSLSATTYYFAGLTELLAEGGKVNIERWAQRAERVATEAEARADPLSEDEVTDLIMRACLPSDETLLSHYLQLLSAGQFEPVAQAYASGRARLDAALQRVLARSSAESVSPQLLLAVIDGAAVSALSEGRAVHDDAIPLVKHLLKTA